MRQVLQALQDNGLVIHAEKCVWGVQELEYLGHKILAAGVLPLPSHVAAIQGFPRPTIIKELQAFLGMVNFYRHAAATDGCLAWRQEGGGQAGAVGGLGCRLCRCQAVPPRSNTSGTSHSGGGAVSGSVRLIDARRGVPAAAVT